MAPLFCFLIFQKYTPGVSSLNSRHFERCIRLRPYHPEHARSRPISEAKQGRAWFSTWMGDRLGIPGAVSFCFSFTGQLTHFSKLQHSCVLLYPFNLIAASFLPFDFSVTSFCFRCDKRQLSLFVLHFSSRGR